jgi:ribosomal protein S27AE
MTFNKGKPYGGSEAVRDGRLTGATDTDYFYFFCPRCGDRHIMRVLEHGFREGPGPAQAYPDMRPRQAHDFTMAFKLYCPQCHLTDFVKIGNTGRQEGQLPEKEAL